MVAANKEYIAQPTQCITANITSLTALSPDEIAVFTAPSRTRNPDTGGYTTHSVLGFEPDLTFQTCNESPDSSEIASTVLTLARGLYVLYVRLARENIHLCGKKVNQEIKNANVRRYPPASYDGSPSLEKPSCTNAASNGVILSRYTTPAASPFYASAAVKN